MQSKFNLELYVVTDRSWLKGARLEDQVEQAVLGGVTLVQLREKSLETGEYLKAALSIKSVTDEYGIPLIINDRLDIALAVDAAGLHVGQNDLPAATARRLLGPEKILGVSVTNRAEAIQAVKDGADYLGVGAVFPTGTKLNAADVSLAELRQITQAVTIPVVAIGGITIGNLQQLKGSGIDGIAVVSAIFNNEDIRRAAETLRREVRSMLRPD